MLWSWTFLFILSLLWLENFREVLFQFYRWISYWSSKTLRKKFWFWQWLLLCIFSRFCIWLRRCFSSKSFSYLLSVVVHIIIFIFRWNLLQWINRFVSISRKLEILSEYLEIFESRRLHYLLNDMIIQFFKTMLKFCLYLGDCLVLLLMCLKQLIWRTMYNGKHLFEQDLALASFVDFWVF